LSGVNNLLRGTIMASKLEKIKKDLTRFNKERKFWLLVSGFITAAAVAISLEWNEILTSHTTIWLVVSVGLIISVIWWYWTMKIVKTILQHRYQEVEILHDLIVDIKEIKTEVSKLKE
jgi:uncharacterized membrane protein